uniref:Uncharacterized protein n=1 Tax=Amphora coffeiformis TaxID=265554 RepID=A0A7S3KZ70_9STRA
MSGPRINKYTAMSDLIIANNRTFTESYLKIQGTGNTVEGLIFRIPLDNNIVNGLFCKITGDSNEDGTARDDNAAAHSLSKRLGGLFRAGTARRTNNNNSTAVSRRTDNIRNGGATACAIVNRRSQWGWY